jgi:hypothetical protein
VTDKHYAALLVFSAGFLLRLVPEMIAYPYPIGYDVINYYIPVLSNFDIHWHSTSHEFPMYVYMLHLIGSAVASSPYVTVLASAIFMFGILSISIFMIGIRILNISVTESVFLSVFVMVQMSVLRTTWDLHKDVFSISLMFFVFSLIAVNKSSSSSNQLLKLIASIILSSIIAMSDRMVGGLFSLCLFIYAIKSKDKIALLSSIAALFVFIIALFVGSTLWNDLEFSFIKHQSVTVRHVGLSSATYNPLNLLISFITVNALLVPAALLGLRHERNAKILKIALLVTIFGSFSWILFPNDESLVANRWIILTGIFLSIFAGNGFIIFSKRIAVRNSKMAYPVLLITIAIFGIIGISYAASPYGSPFILYEIVHDYIGSFEPVSMQFNSMDIRENPMLLSAIHWINKNTGPNVAIIGASHLRGWMELELEHGRTFHFFNSKESTLDFLRNSKSENSYFFALKGENPDLIGIKTKIVYTSKDITISKVYSHVVQPGQIINIPPTQFNR